MNFYNFIFIFKVASTYKYFLHKNIFNIWQVFILRETKDFTFDQ